MNEITKDYQGFSTQINQNGQTTTEVYKGLRSQCDTFMSDKTVFATTSEYGSLVSMTLQQAEGPFWTVTLEWCTEVDFNGNKVPAGSSYGPKSSQLTIRMLSLPLEKSKKYLTNWNYSLAAKGNLPVPQWWYTNKTLVIPANDNDKYKWIKESSELQQGWQIIMSKQKPGYESYSYPIYELTETSKHGNKQQAGWAVAKKAGKIDFPTNGDFDIVQKFGGNWLCEGGSISYDGKYWIANCTFAHSPDGWDLDLYMEVED